MTTFNETEWLELLEKQAALANKGCGLIYELYQRRLSSAIDGLLAELPETHRAQALEIARTKYDYLTQTQIAEAELEDQENGLCAHGIDPRCCPAGCGDIE